MAQVKITGKNTVFDHKTLKQRLTIYLPKCRNNTIFAKAIHYLPPYLFQNFRQQSSRVGEEDPDAGMCGSLVPPRWVQVGLATGREW